MPDWTISIETDFELDEDGLERFAEAFERGFGYMGPACALHSGKLGFTVGVTAANAEEAVKHALAAANASLAHALAEPREVDVAHMHVDRELVSA